MSHKIPPKAFFFLLFNNLFRIWLFCSFFKIFSLKFLTFWSCWELQNTLYKALNYWLLFFVLLCRLRKLKQINFVCCLTSHSAYTLQDREIYIFLVNSFSSSGHSVKWLHSLRETGDKTSGSFSTGSIRFFPRLMGPGTI